MKRATRNTASTKVSPNGRKTTSLKQTRKTSRPPPALWDLRLYVAGQSPKSLAALANLRQVCEAYLEGKYHIEVIDLIQNPQLAAGDQILAIPTLVRKLPEPMRKIIGDLSDTDRVLVGLQLRARDQ